MSNQYLLQVDISVALLAQKPRNLGAQQPLAIRKRIRSLISNQTHLSITISHYSKSMCQLEFSDRLNIDLSRDNVVTLWAERLSPTANPFAGVAAPASRLFFFKFFDPRICSLCYCGHVAVPLPAPPNVADVLQGLLRKRVGLHDDTQLAFFRQDDTGRPQPVDLNTVSLQTKQGEVLYFRVGYFHPTG